MSGSDVQFNVAKGFIGQYFNNVDTATPTNSGIIVVPLMTTGLVADSVLIDYTDLLTLLAGASDEQTTMGRKTLTGASITQTLSQASDYWSVTFSPITWTAAGGVPCAKLLFCYDADTTTGTDSAVIPLLAYSFDATPDGSDIVVSPHANGLIRFS